MRRFAPPPAACILALASAPLAAQTGPAVPASGKDSTFQCAFHFRMQDRAEYRHAAGAEGPADSYEFSIRRLRAKLEGRAFSPKLEYKVQLGLVGRDVDLGDGHSPPNPVLDALAIYRLAPRTKLGIGQGKVPGGRLALVSSSEMELPERSLANSAFTLDRDLGLFAWQQWPLGRQRLHLLAAVTQGEGRASGHGNSGLCYTGRLEWLPLGGFSDGGEYVEGDLRREPAPKLAVAAAYSRNSRARRSRAQMGPDFPGGATRTIGTFFADAMFKNRGWSVLAELERRLAQGPPLVADTATGETALVNEGLGFTGQLGRMLGKRSQLAVRWAMVRPGAEAKARQPGQDEAWLAFSHYLADHRVKLQAGAVYSWTGGVMDRRHAGNTLGALFQVQLGI